MAELDSLEIKISAESARAAENISALATSLENLVQPATSAIEPLTKLSAALQSLKIPNSARSVTAYADALTGALNKLNGINYTFNARKLADRLESLETVSTRLNAFRVNSTKTQNIDNLRSVVEKLNQVESTDNIGKIAHDLQPISQISDSLSVLKGGKGYETAADNLVSVVARLNEIDYNGNLGSFADSLKIAVEKIEEINAGKAISTLAQLSPALEDTTNALNNIVLSADNLGNVTQQLDELSTHIEYLSRIDFADANKITEFANSISQIDIPVSLAKNISDIGLAVQRLSTAKFNENAADNLRYFIDTVRVITEEDIRRLNAFSDAANATRNIKLKNLEVPRQTIDEYTAVNANVAADALRNVSDAGSETTSVLRKLRDAMHDDTNAVNQFGNAVGRIALRGISAELRALTSPLRTVGNAFSKAAKKAGEMFRAVKRIAIYRAIRSAIKAITEGFTEGRENLYQYSLAVGTDFAPAMDKAATAALYLKNSIGAATAPLTQYLVPIIDRAVDSIVELINRFNELTASLTGAATWTRAIKFPTKWQEATDDATASARKLKSTMLGFDELNVIEPTDPVSKKTGFDADDYRKMFEKVQTNLQLNNKLQEIVMPLKLAWNAEGDRTLQTIKNTFKSVIDLFGSIGASFKEVWTNGTGQETLERILQIVQNITGAFGELANGIRKAWEENETGTRLIQGIWNAFNNVLTVVRDIWGSIREWVAGLDWSPLLNALADLGEAIERLTDPNGALAKLAKGVFDKILLPMGKWIVESGLPAAVDLLSMAFDGLRAVLELIEPALQGVLDGLQKIGGLTFNNISGLVTSFSALVDDFSGKEISGEKAQRAEQSNKKLIESLGGEESWYGKLNKKLQDFGSHGMYDFLKTDMYNSGVFWSEVLNGTEDEKSIFGQISDAFKDIHNSEIEQAFGDKDSEIIPQSTIAGFTSDVQTITSGYAKIGDSAADAYDATSQIKPITGVSGFFESFKEEYKSFSADWGYGVDAMRDGWNGFVDGIQTKWDNFKTDWANGMSGISDAASSVWESTKSFFTDGWDSVKTFFTDGIASIKTGISNFASDWTSGWNDIEDSVSNMWNNVKSFFSSGLDSIKSSVSSFVTDWQNGFDGIKETASNLANNLKTGFSDGIDTVRQKFSDFTNDWSIGWDSIKSGIETFNDDWSAGWSTVEESVSTMWENVKTFFSDGWSVVQSGIDTFKEDWSNGWTEAKNSVSGVWTSIKTGFTTGIDAVMKKFDKFSKDWTGGWDSIKNTVKTAWTNVTTTVSTGWENFKNFVSDYSDNWKSGFDNIKTAVSDSWDKITSKIGESFEWNKLSQKVSEYSTAWFDGFNSIKKTVSDAFDEVKQTIGEAFGSIEQTVSGIVESVVGFISKIWDNGQGGGVHGVARQIIDGITGFVTELFDGSHLGNIWRDFEGVFNNVISVFEKGLNWVVDGVNFFVSKVNEALDIHIDIPKWVPLIGGSEFEGFSLPEVPNFTIPKFASGGFPNMGELFVARESGAELVGKIGNQNAVVNNDQIVQAVSTGVYNAMISAINRSKTGETGDGKQEIHIYLDRRELTAEIEQQQRANGVGIMSGVVYG